jgi:hypothetical protein
MHRWRWEFPVPFPTSFANSPKRTCDHNGVFMQSVSAHSTLHHPSYHLRALSRVLPNSVNERVTMIGASALGRSGDNPRPLPNASRLERHRA